MSVHDTYNYFAEEARVQLRSPQTFTASFRPPYRAPSRARSTMLHGFVLVLGLHALSNRLRTTQHRRAACRMIDPRGSEAEDADRERKFRSIYAEEDTGPCREEMSHLHLELDDDGEPEQTRFVYVDEHSCIGCTYCSQVARNTFFMEDDHGRARVYNQGGDTDELVLEAIVRAGRLEPTCAHAHMPSCEAHCTGLVLWQDTCPVNCIHYVSQEDLVTLEICATLCTLALRSAAPRHAPLSPLHPLRTRDIRTHRTPPHSLHPAALTTPRRALTAPRRTLCS